MKISYEKIEYGQELPRFYLPIYRNILSMNVECAPFFIAPFVLIGHLSKNAFWCIWRDLWDTNKLLTLWVKNKKQRGNFQPSTLGKGDLKGEG